MTDFNKKHASVQGSNKVNYALQLKLNKHQIQDKSFKDTLVDNMYDYLILYLQQQSYDIAFPELCLPLIIRVSLLRSVLILNNFNFQYNVFITIA